MSVHRVSSVRGTNYTGGQRPFSTNNPFRNASYDSNIGARTSSASGQNAQQQQQFNNWVQRNQSQMSFSSDDEADSELFRPPSQNFVRPNYQRSNSQGSANSVNSGSGSRAMPPPRMPVPRRSSNNPFSDSLSPDSTGGSNNNNTPPTYPQESNNNSYYSSSNEKSRLRQQEQERESRSAISDDLPPSYEEAAGPKTSKSSYPREKTSSSSSRPHRSQSDSERHRTRVHREWPGDSNGSNGSSKPHRSTSGRTREHRSEREHRSGEHKSSSSNGEHRSHRSRSHRDENGEASKSSRHRSSSHKTDSKKDKSKPKPKNVDTIDKLDVTGLFGGTFHHDGPFDACTPQRNKNQKSAPVLAFPADGPNNSIKGKAPENIKESTIDYVMGRTTEFGDDDLYTSSISPQKQQTSLQQTSSSSQQPLQQQQQQPNGHPSSTAPFLKSQYNASNQSQSTIAAVKNTENITQFDSNKKAIPVHGETTLGLGSSTFLDGAPASNDDARAAAASLSRKKSLKQKLRQAPIAQPQQLEYDEDEPIRFTGGEKAESSGGNSLLKRVRSLKVGRNKS